MQEDFRGNRLLLRPKSGEVAALGRKWCAYVMAVDARAVYAERRNCGGCSFQLDRRSAACIYDGLSEFQSKDRMVQLDLVTASFIYDQPVVLGSGWFPAFLNLTRNIRAVRPPKTQHRQTDALVAIGGTVPAWVQCV